jgi:hypothetical protein
VPKWKLIGPKIPNWVWASHLKRPTGFVDGQIRWEAFPSGAAAWAALDADNLPDGARTLLLVHGTGLRSELGFGGFSESDYARLQARYGGRIIAFEHRAIAHRVQRNASDLIHRLSRAGVRLELDVIGLSRGGLIARCITEGWSAKQRGVELIRIHKLIFVGTPNGGTPSAGRARYGVGSRAMKAWRTDVRRLTLTNLVDREVEHVEEPHSLRGVDDKAPKMGRWPLLHGSQDQVPGSKTLRRLNGFSGPPPGAPQDTRYYGVASVFSFDHGAPDSLVSGFTRSEVMKLVLHDVPNDLVVPTASVYAPDQGAHAGGRFPLDPQRLLVLGPASNVTHTTLMFTGAVRERILGWLAA